MNNPVVKFTGDPSGLGACSQKNTPGPRKTSYRGNIGGNTGPTAIPAIIVDSGIDRSRLRRPNV